MLHVALRSKRRVTAIVVGASLVFSLATMAPAHAEQELTLTIVQGDTLIGISDRFLQDPRRWPELQRFNSIPNDRRLKPGSTLRIPLDWVRWAELTAEVVFAKEVVDGSGKALTAGMQLKAGERFDTGKTGSLTLRLPDGSQVVFPPKTQASLGLLREVPGTAVRATAIELKAGGADSNVVPLKNPASSFEIRTPRVVTAVRGTRFRVAASEDTSFHEVVSGVVGVAPSLDSAPTQSTLNALQGLRADGANLRPPVSLLPPVDVSKLPRRIERTALNLSVPALPGAMALRWQVAANADFTQLLQSDRTSDPSWLLTSLEDGNYFLRVRAADAQGLEGQDAQIPIAVRARPEPPLMRAPAAGEDLAGVVALSWAEPAGAPQYQVQVARDAAFADKVLDRADVKGGQLALDASLAPGTYHWRLATVRAANDKGPFSEGPRGPFGDSAAFTLLPPSTMAPPEVGKDGVKLSWSGPAGFSHRVQVSSDANFGKTEFDEVVPGSSVSLSELAAGVYYVRTQVVLKNGKAGNWSTPQQFEVPKERQWGWLLLLLLPLL